MSKESSSAVRESANLERRLAASAMGTALLFAAVVGSGIMGDRLSSGNVGIALLANTLATGAALATLILILMFGPVSCAHFNPVAAAGVASGWRMSSERPRRSAPTAREGRWAALHLVLGTAQLTSATSSCLARLRTGLKRWCPSTAVFFAIAITASACSHDQAPDEVARRLDDARERTIPPGARQLSFTGLRRDPTSVHAAWEFEVDSSWGHYQLWVKRRLHREFTAAANPKPGVLFTMQLPGDTYNVDVDVLSNGPPLRVRVTFVGRPS